MTYIPCELSRTYHISPFVLALYISFFIVCELLHLSKPQLLLQSLDSAYLSDVMR